MHRQQHYVNGPLVFHLIYLKNGTTKPKFILTKVTIYTWTHARIPAMQCRNIIRLVWRKTFYDQTTVSATSYLCATLGVQRYKGNMFKQISPTKWSTGNNADQVWYYSTKNFLLQNDEILIYDDKGLVSGLSDPEHCEIQSGKYIMNSSIVLWDKKEVTTKCLYREVGTFDFKLNENHVIIDEFQTAFSSLKAMEVLQRDELQGCRLLSYEWRYYNWKGSIDNFIKLKNETKPK